MTSRLEVFKEIDSYQEIEMHWNQLYPALKTLVRPLVYTHMIPVWRGQEDEIVDDIVQETVMRLWKYLRQVEAGQRSPIHSLSRFCYTIALNYCIDLQRKDRHNMHPPSLEDGYNLIISDELHSYRSVENIAIDLLLTEDLFVLAAKLITAFPEKQCQAMLTDLANRMYFSDSPTSLQQAFLSVGVQLQDYQRPVANNKQEERKHAALIAYSYKQLSYMIDKGKKREKGAREDFYDKKRLLMVIRSLKDKRKNHHFEVKNKPSSWCTNAPPSLQLEKSYITYDSGVCGLLQSHDVNQEKNNMAEQERRKEFFDKEQDVPVIQKDSELAALALQLQQAYPPAVVDPLFQETLRARLLEITLQSQLEKLNEQQDGNKEQNEFSWRGTILKVDKSQKCFYQLDEPDIPEIRNDRDLVALAERLCETAPSMSIDPEFREKLRGKLLDIVLQQRPDDLAEIQEQRVIGKTNEAMFNIEHLISLADEIVNFPDQERRALLVDLASRLQGDPYWWHVQQAFLEVGIQIQDYRELLPRDAEAYRWHTTSLDHAYKRVQKLLEEINDPNLNTFVRIC